MIRFLIILFFVLAGCGLPKSELRFLEELTRAVADSSRLFSGQELPPAIASFGPNQTGITLVRPGGRDCYPSFWIRDYSMSLESGMFTEQEQLDLLLFTASRQSDSSWMTATGSFVPMGSIPDHIRVNDGLPVFFPGTYSFEQQGDWLWRLPPYDDQFFFIHMAWFYVNQSDHKEVLHLEIAGKPLIQRLEEAFRMVPADSLTQLAYISDTLLTTDFGFRDVVTMTGLVSFGSVLRWRAANELAGLLECSGDLIGAAHYRHIASSIGANLVPVFGDDRGMLRASTGKSAQPDVWATAFAVWLGVLERESEKKACKVLLDAYLNGSLAWEGQIRHILTGDDFSETTAWEMAQAPLNRYQNGAYWGTATGWVVYAIAGESRRWARNLALDYIRHLRLNDFRLNPAENGGPWECMHPDGNHRQNPVYLTSVTVPYAILKSL